MKAILKSQYTVLSSMGVFAVDIESLSIKDANKIMLDVYMEMYRMTEQCMRQRMKKAIRSMYIY